MSALETILCEILIRVVDGSGDADLAAVHICPPALVLALAELGRVVRALDSIDVVASFLVVEHWQLTNQVSQVHQQPD